MSKRIIYLGFFFILTLAAWSRPCPQAEWLIDCTVSRPVYSGALVVFPLHGPKEYLPGYLSLDQAIKHDQLLIKELHEAGDVNQLLVENQGERAVFIMAGEILSGARQDRVLKKDLWLPAHSVQVTVEAYCVEHGRWSYNSKKRQFDSGGSISNIRVRQASLSKAGQQSVWDSVAETQKENAVSAPSGALQAVYQDRRLAKSLNIIVNNLGNLINDDPYMNGVAVQIGQRIVAVDIFPDRSLLVALWPKLLRSYALEIINTNQKPEILPESYVSQFLKGLTESNWSLSDTPGQGTLYNLNSGNLNGQALKLNDNLVHLQVLGWQRQASGNNPKPVRNYNVWPPAIEMMRPTRPRN